MPSWPKLTTAPSVAVGDHPAAPEQREVLGLEIRLEHGTVCPVGEHQQWGRSVKRDAFPVHQRHRHCRRLRWVLLLRLRWVLLLHVVVVGRRN